MEDSSEPGLTRPALRSTNYHAFLCEIQEGPVLAGAHKKSRGWLMVASDALCQKLSISFIKTPYAKPSSPRMRTACNPYRIPSKEF